MSVIAGLLVRSTMRAERYGVNDEDPLKRAVMHKVDFYVAPRHQVLDVAGPLAAFDATSVVAGRPLYELRVLSSAGGTVRGSAGLPIETTPAEGAAPDTLIGVGGEIAAMLGPVEVDAFGGLARRASRVASVCTGALLLAEAGLLDGRRATTHWRKASELQRRYPAVKVEADRIFIADGPIWTSAGITAGIDLALALIEADHGTDLARDVARELVVYYRRSGGQSQFSALAHMEPRSDRIRIALSFAHRHLSEPLPIERLAEAASLSVRQFGRAFRHETGETPAKAVERLRVEAAHSRLHDGVEPVEQIARSVGFSDPERMRRAFIKIYGMPPQAIRRKHRAV